VRVELPSRLMLPVAERLEEKRERPALVSPSELAREMVSLEKEVLAPLWARAKREKALPEKDAAPLPMMENVPLPVEEKGPVKVEEDPKVSRKPPFAVTEK